MELYTHTKLSTVQRERLELLKKPQLVEFEPFNIRTSGYSHSSLFFKHLTKRFYQSNPGGFAPFLAQSSGVLGQGAFIDGSYFECDCSECDCLNCGVCGS